MASKKELARKIEILHHKLSALEREVGCFMGGGHYWTSINDRGVWFRCKQCGKEVAVVSPLDSNVIVKGTMGDLQNALDKEVIVVEPPRPPENIDVKESAI